MQEKFICNVIHSSKKKIEKNQIFEKKVNKRNEQNENNGKNNMKKPFFILFDIQVLVVCRFFSVFKGIIRNMGMRENVNNTQKLRWVIIDES